MSEEKIAELLSDKISRDAESLIDREERRRQGIFFSGSEWSERLATLATKYKWHRFVDPACGTGDLLAACIQNIRLSEKKRESSQDKFQFIGYEIRKDLASTAEVRLQVFVESLAKGGVRNFKTEVRRQNSLWRRLHLTEDDCVIMNPPYHMMQAGRNSKIGNGTISAAALFIEKVIRELPPGGGLVALVPESIRSGTRYQKLRDLIETHLKVEAFCAAGHFGQTADIDVAIIAGVRNQTPTPVPKSPEKKNSKKPNTINDLFEVKVGSVVPHRTEQNGAPLPYVDVSAAPAWQTVSIVPMIATYRATTVKGPLVVIKRTSSPTDRKRARGTVIATSSELLIENHLIVCRPLDGKVSSCLRLMKSLEDQRTDRWLNHKIRCRHLTTEVVKGLPVWD